MSMWDELIDDHTVTNAWCRDCRFTEYQGRGETRCREIVHAANEHMQKTGHHVVIEVDAGEAP